MKFRRVLQSVCCIVPARDRQISLASHVYRINSAETISWCAVLSAAHMLLYGIP